MTIVLPDPPKVVSLDDRRPKKGVQPMIKTKGREKVCLSHYFEIDSNERTVQCTRCKRWFDPFDAIDYLAKDFTRYAENHQWIIREIEQREKERDAIKKEVQNLKAQRRRLLP